MIQDQQYQVLPRPIGELDHAYGAGVHILSHPYPMSLLAELCSDRCKQPRINQVLGMLFDWLLAQVASRELVTRQVTTSTRMRVTDAEGVYAGEVIDRSQRVVVVDIARAGIVPAQRFFDGLNQLLDPDGVREDHIYMNRATDADGHVVGVNVSGNKIGGSVEDATVIIPDPMGATGGSLADAITRYRDDVPGRARKIIAVHLIITPEYIRRVKEADPGAVLYAIRLDRGMSPAAVLACKPGERWDEESGLNEKQYIVPGGGGFGELINNSWV